MVLLCLAAALIDNFNAFSLVFIAYTPAFTCDAAATLGPAPPQPYYVPSLLL